MDQKLKVIIEAEVRRLEGDLNKAKKQLASLEGSAEKAGTAISKGGNSVTSFGKKTANVTPTLLEFNRVVQDAPFGIQGVANNLTQLTQNFGDLQKSAGGTRQALKALVAGFAGPAGILFAVSAVTSLLVTYGDELFKAVKGNNDLAKSIAETTSQARAEVAELNSLVAIASDQNNTLVEREGAIKKINEAYGPYLGNLSTETINTKEVRDALIAVNNELLRKAKIEGISNRISEVFADSEEELVDLSLKRKEAYEQVGQELNNLSKSSKFFNEFIDDTKSTSENVNALVAEFGTLDQGQTRALASAVAKFKEIDSELKKTEENTNAAVAPLLELSDRLNKQSFNFADDIAAVVVTPEIQAKRDKGIFDNILKVDRKAVLANIFAVTSESEKTLVGFSQRLSGSIGPDIFSKRFDAANERLKLSLTNVELTLIAFNERATQIVNQGTVNALSGLGQALGQALVSGQNLAEALGASLLSSLGSVLTQLGELAIATGVGLLAVQTALSSLNPAIAIAAGIALVALGSAFSAGAQKLSGQFGGGVGVGPASNFSAQQSFTPSQSSFNFEREERDEVVFRVDGTTLVGVLNNASRQSRRNGGALRLT